MATFKAEIYKHQKKAEIYKHQKKADGTWNIKIQLQYKRNHPLLKYVCRKFDIYIHVTFLIQQLSYYLSYRP